MIKFFKLGTIELNELITTTNTDWFYIEKDKCYGHILNFPKTDIARLLDIVTVVYL